MTFLLAIGMVALTLGSMMLLDKLLSKRDGVEPAYLVFKPSELAALREEWMENIRNLNQVGDSMGEKVQQRYDQRKQRQSGKRN